MKSSKGVTATKGAHAINLAGGEAFAETAKLELASIMLTSTLTDGYYRKADATVTRLRELIAKIPDAKFVAKAAIHARREAGMWSVSHFVAAELARRVKGQPWMATFLEKVVRRPDDVLEILACYITQFGRPLPNSLKRGLGRALAGFDAHQLAKFRKTEAEWSLVDAVNLLHPPHTEALGQLVRGSLAAADTWETRLTRAGAAAETEGEKDVLKSEAWADLVRSKKIGYFALLRNLRNILEKAPEVSAEAIALLTDENLIRKSLVMPFRFSTALDALQGASIPGSGPVLAALSDAVDKSLANVPRFPGRTLVALDTSGSMAGRPLKIGSLFAATLAKSNQADLMQFSDTAAYLPVNARDSTLSLARYIEGKAVCAGTNFHCIFEQARGAYDRVIILSDMQGWVGHHTPAKAFAAWKARTGADPKVFSFDLAGLGTLQFPESKVCCLAGFSDQTMQMLGDLDKNPKALLQGIEAIVL